MALNILKGEKPTDRFYADIAALREISTDKLPIIMEFVLEYVLDRIAVRPALVEKLSKQVEISDKNFIRATRVIQAIALGGMAVTKEELVADLQKLELSNEVIDQILNFMETQKTKIASNVERRREEAVPNLSDLNWRVGIRYASGDFLREPTVYALLRIQVYDGSRLDQLYIELDKDDLSILETTLNKMKTKFIEAEKIKEKMFPASSEV
jgi:hypothetical protein